jgi:hypothetical protein
MRVSSLLRACRNMAEALSFTGLSGNVKRQVALGNALPVGRLARRICPRCKQRGVRQGGFVAFGDYPTHKQDICRHPRQSAEVLRKPAGAI